MWGTEGGNIGVVGEQDYNVAVCGSGGRIGGGVGVTAAAMGENM